MPLLCLPPSPFPLTHMCPICWATALASFGILLAISVVTLAATDICTLASATLLGALSLIHQTSIALVPWWLFAIISLAVIARVTYLLLFNRDRLLITRLWTHARGIAATRCPTQGAAVPKK